MGCIGDHLAAAQRNPTNVFCVIGFRQDPGVGRAQDQGRYRKALEIFDVPIERVVGAFVGLEALEVKARGPLTVIAPFEARAGQFCESRVGDPMGRRVGLEALHGCFQGGVATLGDPSQSAPCTNQPGRTRVEGGIDDDQGRHLDPGPESDLDGEKATLRVTDEHPGPGIDFGGQGLRVLEITQPAIPGRVDPVARTVSTPIRSEGTKLTGQESTHGIPPASVGHPTVQEQHGPTRFGAAMGPHVKRDAVDVQRQ
jgi:hypothetical protein